MTFVGLLNLDAISISPHVEIPARRLVVSTVLNHPYPTLSIVFQSLGNPSILFIHRILWGGEVL